MSQNATTPLDGCQQFKAAFLLQCSRMRLSPEAVAGIAKAARGLATYGMSDLIKQAGAAWWMAGLPLSLAVGGGGLLGYNLAHLPAFETADPEELRQQEKIDTYRRITQRMRLQDRLSDGERKAPRPFSRI